MGLVERFSKLRSRWSRNFPPNLARLMLLGCAALWGGSYLLAKFAMEAIPPQWLMGLSIRLYNLTGFWHAGLVSISTSCRI